MWFHRTAKPRRATSRPGQRALRPLQLESLEDRVVPSLVDGSLLIATGPSPFSSQDQSSFPTGIIAVTPAGTQVPVSVGGNFTAPRSITEAPNGQLYVADLKAFGTGAIIQVDPNTGQQTVIAQGGSLNGPIALTFLGGSLYVVNQGDSSGSVHSLVQIDLTSFQQTVITSGGGFVTPTGIAPAPGGNVYVADQPGGILANQLGAVWLVNVTTGQQIAISTGGLFNHPTDVAVEPGGTLMVVNTGSAANNYTGSLVRVDPQTGNQTLLNATFPPDTGLNKEVIASDGTILVSAISNGNTPGRIYAVSPVTGVYSSNISGGNLSLVEGLAIYHAVPSGGGLGDVMVTLDAASGSLNITGGSANDTIAITQSAPGVLQVSNAGAFINFDLSTIFSINIQLPDTSDQVTITGVSVPGSLAINAGAGSDTFTLNAIAASRVDIIGTGADTVSVLNSVSGSVLHIVAGPGSPSITVLGDTSSDLYIAAFTAAGDNATFDLENDKVTDAATGGLTLISGSANSNVTMINITVAYELAVNLGSGVNSLFAMNVTALFGYIDGGTPNTGKNVYIDGGGNSGYFVIHFIGH